MWNVEWEMWNEWSLRSICIIDKITFHRYNFYVRYSVNGRRLQSLPSEMGVMRMQYVTYSDLFRFVLVITSIISVAISLHFEHKKKQPPPAKDGSYFLTNYLWA